MVSQALLCPRNVDIGLDKVKRYVFGNGDIFKYSECKAATAMPLVVLAIIFKPVWN